MLFGRRPGTVGWKLRSLIFGTHEETQNRHEFQIIPTAKFRKKGRGLLFSKALFEGLIFGEAYLRRGLSTEENLRFKIEWASLTVGSKFTVFALFYFVFEGNFPSTRSRGPYIWRSDLTEGFLRYRFGGLIHREAYFRNFETVPCLT